MYPGIDVVYRGTHGRLQCHILVAPGAEPSAITLAISGADHPQLDAEGTLILRSGKTELRLYKPSAHQDVGASERLVSVHYAVHKNRITLAVARYDATKPLVIVPVLNYAAYLAAEDAVRLPPQMTRHD